MVLHDVLSQRAEVGRAAVDVDVQAVGTAADDVGVGAEGVKDALGHLPGAAVGAVEADAEALVRARGEGDQIADVAVASGGVVDRAADGVALGVGELLVGVEIGLDPVEDGLLHLLAVAVDELDAVVVEGVVAGGDHDAAVEVVGARDERHARGRGDVQQIGVGARGGETGAQRVLEHVARAAGVLADDDLGLVVPSVVPADVAADAEGVVDGQSDVGLAAEAVRPKVFTHVFYLLCQSLAAAASSRITVTSGGICRYAAGM